MNDDTVSWYWEDITTDFKTRHKPANHLTGLPKLTNTGTCLLRSFWLYEALLPANSKTAFCMYGSCLYASLRSLSLSLSLSFFFFFFFKDCLNHLFGCKQGHNIFQSHILRKTTSRINFMVNISTQIVLFLFIVHWWHQLKI